MPKAIWNNIVIAESDSFETVEGNTYFPSGSIKREFFRDSATHTTCSWKGVASYYDVVVDGQTNRDAAWYYPQTLPAADNIKSYVAFWRGVAVET
jgi:uncharacterized protein (DUF427 family)